MRTRLCTLSILSPNERPHKRRRGVRQRRLLTGVKQLANVPAVMEGGRYSSTEELMAPFIVPPPAAPAAAAPAEPPRGAAVASGPGNVAAPRDRRLARTSHHHARWVLLGAFHSNAGRVGCGRCGGPFPSSALRTTRDAGHPARGVRERRPLPSPHRRRPLPFARPTSSLPPRRPETQRSRGASDVRLCCRGRHDMVDCARSQPRRSPP